MTSPIEYEANRTTQRRRRGRHPAIVVTLLVLGAQLWLLCDPTLVRSTGYLITCGIVIALAAVPAVRRAVDLASRWAEATGAASTGLRFALVSTLSGGVLYATAVAGRRPFLPVIHDEFSYLLQARTFAEGHLWLPQHPLAAFFDTFYVLVDGVYASQYFPGAAMLYAPFLALGCPFWLGPLVVSASACGAAFLVLREMFDGASAFAGTAAMLGVLGFRYVSISALAQPPAVLWTLVAFWSVLRWTRDRRRWRLVFAGLAIGFAAITRPLDAAAFGACAAALIAWSSRGTSSRTRRDTALACVLPMLPFLAFQLAIDDGITGHWFETPFAHYASRDMPGSSLGFRTFDPVARPVASAPEKQRFYVDRVMPILRDHTPAALWHAWSTRQFRNLAVEVLPDVLFLAIVPLGLLSLGDARRASLAVVVPVWWLVYALHPFSFFQYYVVLIVPALAIVLGGVDALADIWPRRRSFVRTSAVGLMLAMSLFASPQMRRDVVDQPYENGSDRTLRARLAPLANRRLIVLIRDAPEASAEEAVLYNVDRAWPDDADVIRARDLGDRNKTLYDYYAMRQPERIVYLFDRRDNALMRLGSVVDMAAAATR